MGCRDGETEVPTVIDTPNISVNPIPITRNNAGASPVLSGALGSSGTYAFGVGGSVSIDPSTLAGAYTGSFTVTVAYN